MKIGLSIKVKNVISWSNSTVERRKSNNFPPLLNYSNEIIVGLVGAIAFLSVAWPTGVQLLVCFLLLQCSSGVVRHPKDLQVSVATRFCRVLIFASS